MKSAILAILCVSMIIPSATSWRWFGWFRERPKIRVEDGSLRQLLEDIRDYKYEEVEDKLPGNDVNLIEPESGFAPMHIATLKGNDRMLKLLLKYGGDVNVGNKDGIPPLYYATLWDFDNTANLLIRNGANVNQKDYNGDTVLVHAIDDNSPRAVHYLAAAGADLDQHGQPASEYAKSLEREEITKILAKYEKDDADELMGPTTNSANSPLNSDYSPMNMDNSPTNKGSIATNLATNFAKSATNVGNTLTNVGNSLTSMGTSFANKQKLPTKVEPVERHADDLDENDSTMNDY